MRDWKSIRLLSSASTVSRRARTFGFSHGSTKRKRSVFKIHPRGDVLKSLTGVFATRSPDRPNPIGLHRVRVLNMDGNRWLHVQDLRQSTVPRLSISSRFFNKSRSRLEPKLFLLCEQGGGVRKVGILAPLRAVSNDEESAFGAAHRCEAPCMAGLPERGTNGIYPKGAAFRR